MDLPPQKCREIQELSERHAAERKWMVTAQQVDRLDLGEAQFREFAAASPLLAFTVRLGLKRIALQ